jgi:hypothetical protein
MIAMEAKFKPQAYSAEDLNFTSDQIQGFIPAIGHANFVNGSKILGQKFIGALIRINEGCPAVDAHPLDDEFAWGRRLRTRYAGIHGQIGFSLGQCDGRRQTGGRVGVAVRGIVTAGVLGR